MSFRIRSQSVTAIACALGLAGGIAGPDGVAPATAAVLDRASAVARALDRSPEARVDQDAVASASRLENVAGVYPFNPRLDFEAGGDFIGPLGADRSSLRLEVSQEIDTRGERGARRAVASAESELTRASADGHVHALGRRTEEAVSRLLIAHRRAVLADSFGAASARIVATARRAGRQEAISPFTLRQIEIDDARVRDRATAARAEVSQAEGDLRALLLLAPDESIELADDLDGRSWECRAESLSTVALAGRHDVLEAGALEKMRLAEAGLTTREGRPGAEVSLFVERERDRVPGDDFIGVPPGASTFDGFEDDTWIFGAGLSVPLPLFQKNKWQSGRSDIEAARAGAARRRLEARIPSEVRAACDRLALAQERERILGESLSHADGDRELLEAAYREGRIDLDVYVARRNRILESADARLDALAATEAARIELALVTGVTYEELGRALDRKGGGR
ncbi:MAG: TolC family protein [Candidatus Eiseniibacteriota bacterium]